MVGWLWVFFTSAVPRVSSMVFEVVFYFGGRRQWGLLWFWLGVLIFIFFYIKNVSITVWLMHSTANWQDVFLGEMVSAIQYVIQISGP